MTPTPSPQSNFQDQFRFGRNRRQRHPYDGANDVTPTQAQARAPALPLVLDGAGERSIEGAESDGLDEGDDLDDMIEAMNGDANEEEEHEGEEDEEEAGNEEVPMDIDPPFDPAALGLKEIGNLASWTVSTCKPGCGVEALRDDDPQLFWQSDGPQPHHLNIHFSRLVSILSIRIFLDFEQDESYTPTRITLLAGTGYHDLLPFAQLDFQQPKGWIDVPLEHVGGGEDGKILKTFLVQVKITENHQNGKDTHVRGLKVYARDERLGRGSYPLLNGSESKLENESHTKREAGVDRRWLLEPDWMGDAELR